MATKHAKVLTQDQLSRMIVHVLQGPHPERDRVMILLSYKAGLRAQEIAGLEWSDVCDAEGNVRSDHLFVPGDIAKYGNERTLPIAPQLYEALLLLRMKRPHDRYVAYGVRQPKLSPLSVRVWFHRLYQELGLEGCSSHSGRRTFITTLARKCGQFDCSIKDVQSLAGHRHLSTTERYIEPSPSVGRLVAAI